MSNITLAEKREKVIDMCGKYLLDYLNSDKHSILEKSEVIKKLLSLTPEVKSLQIFIQYNKEKHVGDYYFRYNRNEYPELYVWRKEVLKRDNYTCQDCGNTKRELHAHHKERWVDAISLRFEVKNGRTLCDKCHYKTIGRESEYNAIC